MPQINAEALQQRYFGKHEAHTDQAKIQTADDNQLPRTFAGSAPQGHQIVVITATIEMHRNQNEHCERDWSAFDAAAERPVKGTFGHLRYIR